MPSNKSSFIKSSSESPSHKIKLGDELDSSILPGKQDENFKSWSPSLFVAGAVTSRNSLPFKAVAQTNYGNRSESPSSKNYSIIINRQSSFSSPPADDRSNATRSGSHSPSRSDNSQHQRLLQYPLTPDLSRWIRSGPVRPVVFQLVKLINRNLQRKI